MPAANPVRPDAGSGVCKVSILVLMDARRKFDHVGPVLEPVIYVSILVLMDARRKSEDLAS